MLKKKEQFMRLIFLFSACTSIIAVFLICIFLFANGIPAMSKIGVFNFLLGKNWKPSNALFGILPMILGSIYVTPEQFDRVPINVLTAITSSCSVQKLYRMIKPAIELWRDSSVVYGFWTCILVPFIRNYIGGNGSVMLTASILLGDDFTNNHQRL